MQQNMVEGSLLRARTEAIERAHAVMIAPLLGYGLSLLALLACVLRLIPLDTLLFGVALVFPAALTLWAMWRVQKVIAWAVGRGASVYAVNPRVITFTVMDWDRPVEWRIIGK